MFCKKKLDSYIGELVGKNILIKIDTEGNEYHVLKGADIVLSKCKPWVVFECFKGEQRREIFYLFKSYHYKILRLPWKFLNGDQKASIKYDEFINLESTNFIAVADKG